MVESIQPGGKVGRPAVLGYKTLALVTPGMGSCATLTRLTESRRSRLEGGQLRDWAGVETVCV